MFKSRNASVLDILFNPRLYGVIVGVMSLVAMLASLTASVYLIIKYDDIRGVPESLRTFFRYATLETVIGLIGLIVVVVYLIGICKANEHYLMPFLVLLVVDFSGYIVSETLGYLKGTVEQDRWKENLLDCAIFVFSFTTVTSLYDAFKRERQPGCYRLISGDEENIPLKV
ncbi:uncharacterized protein LOC129768762 [Toxorhynchites rutilus septentrionalis]|uniref:uncharacterized protein LOC129768762 n=1 Tax=Toxorhynchites rutilus septentrionalis TaxID=329112 RepID=UPI002478CE27|nr:uncharacterized protein LOC129768762 [Toxorhynchites rutilus septentrionalis]